MRQGNEIIQIFPQVLGPSDNFVGVPVMNYAFPMEESDGKQHRVIPADTGPILAMESGGRSP